MKHICTYNFLIIYCRMPGLSCRFYQHKFPEVEDVVMVNVRSIAEMGAYVSLLEYNNIEGMILLSELSRRRIRSINKLIRIGRNECVVVIRVDKEKGKLHNKYSNFFNPQEYIYGFQKYSMRGLKLQNSLLEGMVCSNLEEQIFPVALNNYTQFFNERRTQKGCQLT